MSLNDWLNSTVGESAPPDFRQVPRSAAAAASAARVNRSIVRSTTFISGSIRSPARSNRFRKPRHEAPRNNAPRGEPQVARQLNDAISRLDARLSQITNPVPPARRQQDAQRQAEMVERAAAQVYSASPSLSPSSFDSGIAEIAARRTSSTTRRARCRRARRRRWRRSRRSR